MSVVEQVKVSEQVRKCNLCPEKCYCKMWKGCPQITPELIKILIEQLSKPLLREYGLVLDEIVVPDDPKQFARVSVHNINTGAKQSILFTIGDYGSGEERHKIFLDLFSLIMAPLSHILNSKRLSGRIKTFNVILNGDAMLEFYVNPLKQDSTTIKINMAQERHFDESGKLKDRAIELAFLEGVNDFEFMPMIEAITFERLRAEQKVYYIENDLPQDKIPVAVYFKETIEQLNGISPFTRKHFNPIDVKEYVVPDPIELVELRKEMRIKQLPLAERTASTRDGKRCIGEQQLLMKRCLTGSDDKQYPDGFTPRFRKDLQVVKKDDSPATKKDDSLVVKKDDDGLPPFSLPSLTRQRSITDEFDEFD